MIKKKKLIFFSKNMNIGGMEKALLILLNSLVEEGYLITLVLEEKKGELLKQLNSNIIVQEYSLCKSKNVLKRKMINLYKRSVWCFKNKNKYDFSCNYATYSIIGSRLALYASKKSLLYVHSNYYDMYQGSQKQIKEFFNQLSIHKFWKIAFVSNQSMESMKLVYPSLTPKFLVLNNLFDYHFFESIKLQKSHNQIQKSKNKKVFLFLGRLDESSKKITRLLDAMKIHKQNNSNVILWIVGTGPDENRYKKIVEKENLTDYVLFFGAQLDTWQYLELCDYLVLTSDYEGFPVTYFEAIYFKKPIVTTIEVSDQFIDIMNYGLIVDKNAKAIVEGMLNIQKKNINYCYDFKKVQKSRMQQYIEVIEMPIDKRS